MAYTGNNLSRIAQTMEGTQGTFFYVAPAGDTLAQITGAGYFTDGNKRGMAIGDVVWVVLGGANYECYVATIGTAVAGVSAVTIQQLVDTSAYPTANFRNLWDGGDASTNPWQRGTTISGIVGTLTYTADRMFMLAGAATSASMVQTANTSVSSFAYAFVWGRSVSNVTSVSAITLGQVLETGDSYRAQGQQIVFSFWASGNSGWVSPTTGANVLGVVVGYGTGTNQSAASAVAGTWTGYGNAVSTTQALTSAPVRYTFTGNIPTSATQIWAGVNYTPASTTSLANETVNMWGIQLEIGGAGSGGVATPFEHRDVEVELALAQRYYFVASEPASGIMVGAGSIGPTASAVALLNLPVQMRAAPTVTVKTGSFGFTNLGVYTAIITLSAGVTHTVNYINVFGSISGGTSGNAGFLVGGGGNGTIAASADL
jgi:hypothetical protein